jgi:AraC family transcriptional regulator
MTWQTKGHNARLLFWETKVWAGVEVSRYRFPPGERKVAPLDGHVLRLHQSDPHYLVQRLGGRTLADTETSRLITIIPAEHPFEQIFQVESEDFNIVLPDRLIRRAAQDAGLYPDRVNVRDTFCADDPHVLNLGLALGSELQSNSLAEDLYVESLSYALSIHLVRKYSSLSSGLERVAERLSGRRLSAQVLRRVVDYVHENLHCRLTLRDIAAAANLSPYHFSRLFKATTGLSPHQFVIEERTTRARDLLVSTDLPLHEIAMQVGFADQSHLGRHFRRRYGETPARLRWQHQRGRSD